MGKRLEKPTRSECIVIKLPLDKILVGDIIEDYWADELITRINGNKLKTVRWFRDSLAPKIAENTYQIFETEKRKVLLYNIRYYRPRTSTKHYNQLIKKLEETDIKSPFS